MEKQGRTELQDILADVVTRSGKTRDHFDSLLRKKLETTGKPLWDVERGKVKKPSPRILRAMEEVLGLQSDYLVDLVHPRGDPPSKAVSVPRAEILPPMPIDAGEIVQIQKLDLSLSMGPGTLIDDWVESEPVTFDLAFIRLITRSPPHCLKLVGGIGDSMYPTLNWGDAILVDTTDKQLSKQDGIYWINLYGAAGIKRLRTVGPGRVLIKSDNPTVDDQEVDLKDLRIEGRAIWFARGL